MQFLKDFVVSLSKLVDAQYKMFAKYDSLIFSEKPLYSNENMLEDITFINGCDEIVVR